MKIINLYSRKREIPFVTLTVVLACITITVFAILIPKAYKNIAWSNYPNFVWQYVSGVFLHGDGSSISMAIAHLIANLLMFVPYAVMIEKLLGHKMFLIVFLVSWIGISIAFQIITLNIPNGETAYGAGLSGCSFTVTAIGAYILYCLFETNKKLFFKQPLAYVFLTGLFGELSMLQPYIAGTDSMFIHLTGLVIGIITSIVLRKPIRSNIKMFAGQNSLPQF